MFRIAVAVLARKDRSAVRTGETIGRYAPQANGAA